MQPESGTTHYYSDNVGNVTGVTDACNVNKNYTYDALNRLTSASYSDGTPNVTYTYDNGGSAVNTANTRGRLLSVANSSSTINYTSYDGAGHLLASSQATGGQTYHFSYSYNRQGALTNETLPDGRAITTSFDRANRVATLAETLGNVTTNYVTQLPYWPNGMVSNLTRGNNVALSQSIDNRQRLGCAIETDNANGGELWTGCIAWNANNTAPPVIRNS